MSVLIRTTAMSATALALASCVQTYAPAPRTAPLEAKTAESDGAYMIVMGRDYDAADLAAYAATLPPIYAKYGGRYVSFTTEPTVVEGRDDYQAVIISAWPDVEAAEGFWWGPEYRESIELRDGIGDWDIVIVPALP